MPVWQVNIRHPGGINGFSLRYMCNIDAARCFYGPGFLGGLIGYLSRFIGEIRCFSRVLLGGGVTAQLALATHEKKGQRLAQG
jgi:hypothetical protein